MSNEDNDYEGLVARAQRVVAADYEDSTSANQAHMRRITILRLADAVESQRSRIAALKAVIEKAPHGQYCELHFGPAPLFGRRCNCWKSSLAPSTVLDQMIREAKAEGWDEGATTARGDVKSGWFVQDGTLVLVEPPKNPHREVTDEDHRPDDEGYCLVDGRDWPCDGAGAQ